MNTTKQDLAVTIGLIADVSRAFRFDAVKELVDGEPQFTCELLENVDKTFVPFRRTLDFRFTDRKNRGIGNCHIRLVSEEGDYGNAFYMTICASPVNEVIHQRITRAAYEMVRTLLKDIDLEVGIIWIGR